MRRISALSSFRSPWVLAALITGAFLAPAQAQDLCADVPTVLSTEASAEQIHCALSLSRQSSINRSVVLVEKDPELDPVRFGITFEFGSAALTAESKILLAKIATVISANEGLSNAAYFIDGHTDAVGLPAANDALGLSRAQSAASYLLEQTEKPLAVKVRSFGETRLLNTDAPNDGINRRVEITPVAAE